MTTVFIETGSTRVFASALEWPGWSRLGKTEEAALDALAAYASRYQVVTRAADVRFAFRAATNFEIVERCDGSGATDFGVPERVAAADAAAVTAAEAERLTAIVSAAWDVFADVVAGAPAELRKGPRGGGRDRDKIVGHVVEAEASYARKLGIRVRPPDPADRAAVGAMRDELLAAIGRESDGAPAVEKGWPTRYAARRIAWHVLDHAWEIEDRSTPVPDSDA